MFHPSDVKWWAGLVTCICGALLGQAELIGEPWRHWVSIVFIACTAITGFMIRGNDSQNTSVPSVTKEIAVMHFDLKKFASLVSQLGPIILPMAGVPPALSGLIVHGITVAEAMPGKSGAEKKAYVQELVRTGAEGINIAAGKPTINSAELASTVGLGIDAVLDTIKTVKNIPVNPPLPNG